MGPYPNPGPWGALDTASVSKRGGNVLVALLSPLSQGDEDVATPFLLVVSSGAAKESRTSPAAHRYRDRKRSGEHGSIPIPTNGTRTRFDVRPDTLDATWLDERTTKF
jgi:hypothetical protein